MVWVPEPERVGSRVRTAKMKNKKTKDEWMDENKHQRNKNKAVFGFWEWHALILSYLNPLIYMWKNTMDWLMYEAQNDFLGVFFSECKHLHQFQTYHNM